MGSWISSSISVLFALSEFLVALHLKGMHFWPIPGGHDKKKRRIIKHTLTRKKIRSIIPFHAE